LCYKRQYEEFYELYPQEFQELYPQESIDYENLVKYYKDQLTEKIMNSKLFKKNDYKYEDICTLKKLMNDEYFASVTFFSLTKYTIEVYGNELSTGVDNKEYNYGYTRAHPSQNLSNKYLNKFAYIQSVIDAAIIEILTNRTFEYNINVGYLAKPPISYLETGGIKTKYYCILLNFIFIPIVPVITTLLVKEKKRNIKEYMKIHGVKISTMLLSWEIIYFIMLLVISAVITLFCVSTKQFVTINPFILYIVFFLYGISTLNIGFLFSTVLNNPKISGFISFALMVINCMSYFFISYCGETYNFICSIIFSPITFGNIMERVLNRNINEEGVFSFNSFFSPEKVEKYDNISYIGNKDIKKYIILLFINGCIYNQLSKIIEIFISRIRIRNDMKISINDENNYYYKQYIERSDRLDDECIIDASEVSKVFEDNVVEYEGDYEKKKYLFNIRSNRKFLALRRINVKIYKEEIFAILGKKNSGKSVLLEILSGLRKPSSGNISFNGESYDSKEFNNIRKEFGKYIYIYYYYYYYYNYYYYILIFFILNCNSF